jgi:hypothetical protein
MTKSVDIPGVGTVDFPDEMSEQEIAAAINEMIGGDDDAPMEAQSALGTFADRGVSTFLNNVLALPSGMGTMLAFGGAGLEGLGAKAVGGDFDFRNRFEAGKQQFPANLLRAIPAPTVEGMGAGLRSLPALFPGGDSYGERFDESLAQIEAEREANAAANPISAVAGDVAGDVATIFTGRAPFARGINRAETALTKTPVSMLGAAGSNASFLLNRTIASAPMRTLARGAGRTVEAGFEAAVLDVLKGDDPLETAAYAAAGQAGGSLLLHTGKGLVSGGLGQIGLKLGMAALAVGSTLQLLKSATPGGQNSVIDSVETGYGKVTWSLALGALSGMAGAGRLRGGEWAERFPIMTDALSTIPRASVISAMEDWRDAGEATRGQIEVVVNQLMKEPEYFGTAATAKLAQAMEGGDLSSAIAGLMENQEFRKRYDALHPFNALPKYTTGGRF